MPRLVSAANRASIVSSTTRLAPTSSIAAFRRMNRPVEIVFPGLVDLAAVDRHVVDHELLARRSGLAGRSRASATFCARSPARSSKQMNTPGSLCCWMPRTRNSMAEQRLPATGAAADQRWSATRDAAAGDRIQAADPGRTLRQLRQRCNDGFLGATHNDVSSRPVTRTWCRPRRHKPDPVRSGGCLAARDGRTVAVGALMAP